MALAGLQLSQAGDYFAVVTNAFGAATSLVATVMVDPWPVITAQPLGQEVEAGADLILSVISYGHPPGKS